MQLLKQMCNLHPEADRGLQTTHAAAVPEQILGRHRAEGITLVAHDLIIRAKLWTGLQYQDQLVGAPHVEIALPLPKWYSLGYLLIVRPVLLREQLLKKNVVIFGLTSRMR